MDSAEVTVHTVLYTKGYTTKSITAYALAKRLVIEPCGKAQSPRRSPYKLGRPQVSSPHLDQIQWRMRFCLAIGSLGAML